MAVEVFGGFHLDGKKNEDNLPETLKNQGTGL